MSPTPVPAEQSIEEQTERWLSRRVADDAQAIADRLSDLSATVARQAQKARDLPDSTSADDTYAKVVSDMVHALMWGVANMSLDGSILVASQADTARLQRRAKDQAQGEDSDAV